MARFKTYDYRQRVLLPVSLEDQLMPGTLEFAIHTLVEKRLDMSVFEGKYRNDETGRAAYDPKVLLKVVLLAYSRGLISSRKIEQACHENVVFMALACGQQPDHSTLAAFVSSMKDEPVGRESEAHPAFSVSQAWHLGKLVWQIVLGDRQSRGKISILGRRSTDARQVLGPNNDGLDNN